MKAQDLKLEEIIDFSEGRIDLSGRRLVIHAIHAFAHLRKDLVEMIGFERTRRILTRFGFYWGQADAAAMVRIFNWDNLTEWIKAGPRLHTLQGVTRSVVKSLLMDEQTGHFEMEVTWHDSGEAEEHLIEFGRSYEPVCWMLTGYASGYATFCFGKNIYFVEEKCCGKGDQICSAIGKDEKSWGDEAAKFAHDYREVEGIQSKILDLTNELKTKSRQLELQRKRVKQLQEIFHSSFAEIRSESYRRTLELADRVARFDSSILITGESGVGKEILARHIHSQSPRATENFLAINCGALPETLMESELFGHKAGSFTGATHDRVGLFEQANKGTIFLDEIGDISQAIQVKLLRVLQNREIMRVGESKTSKIDVRVIAATNRDLSKAISEGHFREDLYYRLGVIEIEVPPLRQRKDDILPLARHFVKQFSKKLNIPKLNLDPQCLNYLQEHMWPGNVRELENAIERAAVLCKGDTIFPEYLPPAIIYPDLKNKVDRRKSVSQTLTQMEAEHIREVLESVGGNRSKAAKILGISSTTLWRKLKDITDEPLL